MNITFVSSQGGHSGQIKIIFTNEVIGDNNAVLITERPKAKGHWKDKSFNGKFRTYFFEKDILLKLNPFSYLSAMIKLMKIFRDEKTEVVVTNGAQLSIPALIGAKLMGIKTVFIDTVIRVKTPNWSAKACYYFSDIFLVQHEEMIKKYGKNAIYAGGIL